MECNFENCPNFERLGKKFADRISELEQENEKLREDYIKLSQQKDLDNARWQKRCTDLHIEDKAKADKYWLALQEIKAITECAIDNDNSLKTDHCFGYCDECSSFERCKLYPYWQITHLITKAEEE